MFSQNPATSMALIVSMFNVLVEMDKLKDRAVIKDFVLDRLSQTEIHTMLAEFH